MSRRSRRRRRRRTADLELDLEIKHEPDIEIAEEDCEAVSGAASVIVWS